MISFSLPIFAITVIGFLLFIVLVRFFPRNHNLQQNQQWKISILYSIGAFITSFLLIIAIWIFVLLTAHADNILFSIKELTISLSNTLLVASWLSIYFAIPILFLVYKKFKYAPWSIIHLQIGAHIFDSLLAYIQKLYKETWTKLTPGIQLYFAHLLAMQAVNLQMGC